MIKVDLENLSPPKSLLPTLSAHELAQKLVKSPLYHEIGAQPLVDLGRHAFLLTLEKAWQDHRPIVISPDMIWLLISQGFSHYVCYHADELRDDILQKDSQSDIQIEIHQEEGDPLFHQSLFDQFEGQMRNWMDPILADVFTANFSTTSPTDRVVHVITMMGAMTPYMGYSIRKVACGIPYIQLEGSPSDWAHLIEKTRFLKRYKLDWWIDKLIPILENIQETAQGHLKKDFWKKIFKIYDSNQGGRRVAYMDTQFIDGWIVSFFPFDKFGNKREKLKISLRSIDNLPAQLVSVPVNLTLHVNGKTISESKLQFLAGFVGASQDPETFALRPQLGWVVAPDSIPNNQGGELTLRFKNLHRFPEGLTDRLIPPDLPKEIQALHPDMEGKNAVSWRRPSIYRNLSEEDRQKLRSTFPEAFSFQLVSNLELGFIGKVDIPDVIFQAQYLRTLKIEGTIADHEISRLKSLLPKTRLKVNGKIIDQLEG